MTSEQIRKCSDCSLALGLNLVAASVLLPLRPEFQSFDRPGLTVLLCSGVGLSLCAVVARLYRRGISERLASYGAIDRSIRNIQASRPFTTLFIISFVILFVEVMLIRYAGSQIRIFSFFKNIPLIGAFLGLGLGCCLGRGKPEHVLSFLLWLVPLAFFLSQGTLVINGALGWLAALSSSEHILGDVAIAQSEWRTALTAQIFMGLFCVAALIAITLLFAYLGRLLGEAFHRVPRISGYTVNILGSLSGTMLFFAWSYLEAPPWVWFLCGLTPLLWWMPSLAHGIAASTLIALSTIAVIPSYGETVWSAYQKLVGHKIPLAQTGEYAYLVQISDVFYQVAVDLRPEAVVKRRSLQFPHYDRAFQDIGSMERVLIVGAGTGNDVAAALRAGAKRVDAVDIDPAIVSLGRRYHPERPYSDPRVTVLVDDARAAFRKLPVRSYDVVVFGLLDSHTQLAMSSVRLDNYVFTLESFAAAKRLLKPRGHIVVTAATFREWFRDRLRAMMNVTCSGPVKQEQAGNWTTYVCQPHAPAGEASPTSTAILASLPTDDWPFLYLPSRGIPLAYLIVVGLLAVTSFVTLKRRGLHLGEFSGHHGHLFFLGAAFLLMEVSAINRLALLFGTTWVVSVVTIICVLVLIVLANLTVATVGSTSYRFAYTALFLTLLASFAIAPAAVLGERTIFLLGYGLLCLSPVYFAGLVFARSFSEANDPGTAMGANILGAVLGGWSEYSTMLLGIRAMVILAAFFYLCSLLSLIIGSRHRPGLIVHGEV